MGIRSSSPGNVHVWTDHSNFIGVSCGWDFTAEHECGIKRLKDSFGIDSEKIGLDGRKVSKTPYVGLDEIKGINYLWHTRTYSWREPETVIPDYFLDEVKFWGDVQEHAGWGEDSFCFATKDKKTKRFLSQLHEAFAVCDVAMYLGASGPFANGGLNLVIASRMPAEFVNKMRDADIDARKLKQAAKDTGIEERLREAGKGWYALSPRWANGRVKFWLNPIDQQRNNYGWFTVEELEQWIDGKGPIPMKKTRV